MPVFSKTYNVGMTVIVVVGVMKVEQSDWARTGRVDFRLEFVTVRARRQLSAIHPGAARSPKIEPAR